MRTWETTIADGKEYVELHEDTKMVVIHGWKGHWKNDTGNSTSFENFLNGEFHDWIRKHHGQEVLLELIKLVKARME